MKSYIILSIAALAAGSIFSHDPRPDSNNSDQVAARVVDSAEDSEFTRRSLFSHDPCPVYDDHDHVVPREVNPVSMDPTRLSVLSVLKTAIPCSARVPQSTGNLESWYSELPADVKALLPSLYPISSTASALASISPVSTSCTSSTMASASVANVAISDVSTAACSTSQILSTTHLTITKTVYYTPSATAFSNSSRVYSASNGTAAALNSTYTVPSATGGIIRSATPKPSPLTGGVEKVLEVETIAVFAWVGLAAGFILFG